MLVLRHTESELHYGCLVGFLTFEEGFDKFLRSFHSRMDQLGNRTSWFIGLSFLKHQLRFCIELDEQVPDY